MKMSVNNYKKLQVDEQYKLLRPIVEKLYKKYSFLNYSERDYQLLVKDWLNEFKTIKIEDEEASFNELCMTYLDASIKKHVRDEMLKDTGVAFVNNYIDYIIQEKTPYSDVANAFSKLCNFFDEIDYTPTPEICFHLLNESSNINNILSVIVTKNINVIKKNKADTIFQNDIACAFIEFYCMSNNILIENDYESEDISFGEQELLFNNSDYMVKMYLNELPKDILTAEEEKALAYRVLKQDQEAIQIMINRNLKLVVSIAKNYLNKGMELLDLIQEGNLGLMKAISRYDVTKGFRFSTYATWWIKQAIMRAIPTAGRNISISNHLYEDVKKYQKAYATLSEQNNCNPTILEVANYLGISFDKACKINSIQFDTISTNLNVNEDDDVELEDLLPSNEEPPDEIIAKQHLSQYIKELIIFANLSEREMLVLMLRYGLIDDQPKTLEEIGKIFDLSRERIRQIEIKALNKIRQSDLTKQFVDYAKNPDKALGYISSYDDQKKVKNRKETTSIYDLFKTFSCEQVDLIITTLTPEEQELIIDRTCEGTDSLTKKSKYDFALKVFPKMYNKLKIINKANLLASLSISNKTMSSLDNAKYLLDRLIYDFFKTNGKIDIRNMQNLLYIPNSIEVLNTLNLRDLTILSLAIGYNTQSLTIGEISNFFNIKKEEVINIIQNILFQYENSINDLIYLNSDAKKYEKH